MAQYPENLVPNSGFENGSGTPNCNTQDEDDFNDAIDAWWASGYESYFFNNPTPDWCDANSQLNNCGNS